MTIEYRSLKINKISRVPLLASLWIITGVLCVKDVPFSEIVALVGDATYLPCDISTSHEDDAVRLVLWYREDLGTPIYSVDARERDFQIAERWSDDTVLSNRAFFVPEKQPAELGIERVRETDAGLYRCRVDFQFGQTRNSKVNLTVVVPPEKIQILDNEGVLRNSVVGPYAEGETLQLFCDVYGGKPKPSVVWYRNERIRSNETSVTTRDDLLVSRSEIVISNLGRTDVRSEITCIATNNDKSIPLSASVHVDMNFGPLDVRIIAANQPLSAGRRYDLLCETSGSRPPATVTWWRNGQRLEGSKETTSKDGNTTTSILSFVATKEDAGKRLSCRAENHVIGDPPIEDEWTLEIRYVPETRVHLGTSLNPSNIREGTDVYFDCSIKADPAVYKVQWRHRGIVLQHNVALGIIISNRSLVLQGVDRKNAGNYTCVAYNSEGDGESDPFYLNVMFAPTCKPNQTRVHGVAKQEKANISCQVDANPSEVKFRWTFNNSAESMDVAAGHIARIGTSSIVSYTPMTELDYGTLLCWASNRVGHQRVPCVYHIIAAGRPDMVHNCTTSNSSKNSFFVRCTEGFNGGLPQSFLLEVRESKTQQIRANVSSVVPKFTVSDLEPGTVYQACIYAFNDKGRSEPTVVQSTTLTIPEKHLTPAESDRTQHRVKLTPMLSVMIGVVTALVIVAIVVMIVLRLQHAPIENGAKLRAQIYEKTEKQGISIQRELCLREGGHLLFANDKHSPSPFRKLESTGEFENDDKNPDIIPQQITGEEPSDYLRKRRLVSTIETSSTSRNLTDHPSVVAISGQSNYVGYCTMRNGMPLRDLTDITLKHKNMQPMSNEIYGRGICTLPRQYWSNNESIGPMTIDPPPAIVYAGLGIVGYSNPSNAVLIPKDNDPRSSTQCCLQSQQEPISTTIPTILSKRESSV